MKLNLIDLDTIPNERKLISILGDNLYDNYLKICNSIESSLLPDIDRWAKGGRRGKYYHGYVINKRSILIDLYLISESDFKQLTVNFHFRKKVFDKLNKSRALLSEVGQQAIESCEKIQKEYYSSGYYLELRLKNDREVFFDIMIIIDVISGKSLSD